MTDTLDLAAVDGRKMPRTEAVIAATDEGLLRGDGAFEVARLYRGIPFAWDDHVPGSSARARRCG